MFDKYTVIAENCRTFGDANILFWKYGLRYCGRGEFRGKISKKKYIKFEIFCHKHHIRYHLDNPFGNRSGDYRRAFLSTHSPAFGKYYFCAYCGFPVSERNLSVDHLIPVGRVNKSPVLQKRLKRWGYESVNDPRNLVASCKSCNMKKGTKMGHWVFRGRIGKCVPLWYIRHFIRITALLILIYYAAPMLAEMARYALSVLSTFGFLSP